MLDKWVDFVRRAGDVTRFHTERCIRPNTVAQHSFNVALLVLYMEPQSSSHLLKAALFHDLAERVIGDVPAPVKWAKPTIKTAMAEYEDEVERMNGLSVNLSQQERNVLKWADCLDAALYCLEERRMGNENLGVPFSRLMEYMRKLPSHPVGVEILNQLLEEMGQ